MSKFHKKAHKTNFVANLADITKVGSSIGKSKPAKKIAKQAKKVIDEKGHLPIASGMLAFAAGLAITSFFIRR